MARVCVIQLCVCEKERRELNLAVDEVNFRADGFACK